MKYNVSGLGNPLIDILLHVDDKFLKDYNLNKGVMHLINLKEKSALFEALNDKDYKTEVGGSCANTITTLSKLGVKTALAGMVGDDDLGNLFIDKIIKRGIGSYLEKTDMDTGISIVLITPDGERTMNTYLGASKLYSPENIKEEMIAESEFFYFTGYMWDTENQKEATLKAIKIAKDYNTKVIFDLADPFAVNRYREDFYKLLERDVDIALANSEEARLLTDNLSPEKAISELGKLCDTFIIKNGDKETFISNKGNIFKVESFKTKVVDTTGAGDNFAAGFIYGLINGIDIENSCRIASYVALKTIEKIGAQAPEDIAIMLKNKFGKIIP